MKYFLLNVKYTIETAINIINTAPKKNKKTKTLN